MTHPFKLGALKGANWVAHHHPRTFEREQTTGPERLRIGVPAGTYDPLEALLPLLGEPLYALYVLHTPRGGSLPGRYESPAMTRDQVDFLLGSHKPFLTCDARHDLWLGDERGSLLVW